MEQTNPTSINPELQKFLDSFMRVTIQVSKLVTNYPSAKLEWRHQELMTYKSIDVYSPDLNMISAPILRDLILISNNAKSDMDCILYVSTKMINVETKSGYFIKVNTPCVTIQCSQK